MKPGIDKLDVDTLTNAAASLNNFKTKVSDLHVGKLQTVPVDLKKLNDVVDNEIAWKHKIQHTKTKVNNLEKKIPDAAILIHKNQ